MTPAEVAVWIDGQPALGDAARVSVFDRGFLYGDSVFETLRTYQGRPFALDSHLRRLEESAQRVLIALPVPLSTLRAELTAAVEQAGHAESYVRLMITRGQGPLGLHPGNAQGPLRVLLVAPLAPLPEQLYADGVAVVSFVTARPFEATAAAGAKLGNYLLAVLAADVAQKSGAHESLLVDSAGYVSEGTTSNVFWVEGGKLWTPPLSAGILAGITRAHVIECAQVEGVEVEERLPHTTELLSAQEVFLSSSIRELLPVTRLDGQPIAAGRPGPLTQRLLQVFRAHARAHS